MERVDISVLGYQWYNFDRGLNVYHNTRHVKLMTALISEVNRVRYEKKIFKPGPMASLGPPSKLTLEENIVI